MDAFYKELYVVYFRKWLFNQQNKTCIVYNDPQDQDTVILEEKNCLCKITFNLHSIIEFTIINKKTKKPQMTTVVKIAKALDLDEHEFAELCGYRKDDKDGI